MERELGEILHQMGDDFMVKIHHRICFLHDLNVIKQYLSLFITFLQ